MRFLLTMSDAMARVCAVAGRLGSWLIVPLILVIVYDVVTRKIVVVQQFVMNSWLYDFLSPTKLQELEWHLHAVIFLMAYGLAYLNGTHVRVDIWREQQPERRRGWVELIALLAFAMPYCGVLIYYGWQFVVRAYVQGEGSPAMTGIPHRWIIKSFLLLGVTLLFSALLATLLRLVVYLFGPPALGREALARLDMIDPAAGRGDAAAEAAR